jgi:peroxiredoxin
VFAPQKGKAVFMSRIQKIDPAVLASYISQHGQTLVSLSAERPQFVAFLRHFGCTFCREMVADLAARRKQIEAAGSYLAFVHLGTEEKAKTFFAYYKLDDAPRFSDPEARLYQAFGLVRAELRQYLNFESLYRTLMASFHGHFVGFPAGDVKQMPGVFLLQNAEIRKAFRPDLVSDRPDYLALATPA